MRLQAGHARYLAGIVALVVVPLVLLQVIANDRASGRPQAETAEVGPAPPGQATTLTILSPKDGAVIKGSRVVVRFKVNGRLTPPALPLDRHGGLVHLHAILDGGKLDKPANSSGEFFSVEKSAGSYSALAGTSLTYQGVPPGPHRFRVEVVHHDHNPAQGVAGAAIAFTIVGL